MPYLTIFSAPKPFSNPHIATIQRNAIQSWLHLDPDVEIFLVGDEPGMAEVADEFHIRQLANVMRNEGGTPLVNSIFDLAREASTSPFLAYVNADILLLPDTLRTTRQVASQAEQFLIIGQRWDLDVLQALDFGPGWDQLLIQRTHKEGLLHAPAGSDYFIFPCSLFVEMPEFAIGRAGWDNWMIFHARRLGLPVVDATPSLMVIHQNHDYNHLPGGRPHYDHAESRKNEALAGGSGNLFMVLDSDKQLINGRVRSPHWTLIRILRRAEVRLTLPESNRSHLQKSLARRLRRLRRRLSGSLT
jgi:hypothetical protein